MAGSGSGLNPVKMSAQYKVNRMSDAQAQRAWVETMRRTGGYFMDDIDKWVFVLLSERLGIELSWRRYQLGKFDDETAEDYEQASAERQSAGAASRRHDERAATNRRQGFGD